MSLCEMFCKSLCRGCNESCVSAIFRYYGDLLCT